MMESPSPREKLLLRPSPLENIDSSPGDYFYPFGHVLSAGGEASTPPMIDIMLSLDEDQEVLLASPPGTPTKSHYLDKNDDSISFDHPGEDVLPSHKYPAPHCHPNEGSGKPSVEAAELLHYHEDTSNTSPRPPSIDWALPIYVGDDHDYSVWSLDHPPPCTTTGEEANGNMCTGLSSSGGLKEPTHGAVKEDLISPPSHVSLHILGKDRPIVQKALKRNRQEQPRTINDRNASIGSNRDHSISSSNTSGGVSGEPQNKPQNKRLRQTPSKTILSERNRRKKLTQQLYSLRSLVPKISKMDKASVMVDAIEYVRHLHEQLAELQSVMETLESGKGAIDSGLIDPSTFGKRVSLCNSHDTRVMLHDHRIDEFEVTQLEKHTFQLRVLCTKGNGVLVQLTRALEALDFEIVNANCTSINNQILSTVLIEVTDGTKEGVHNMIVDTIPQFGLFMQKTSKRFLDPSTKGNYRD